MKAITSLTVFILFFVTSGVATAADVTISEPFPDGYVLNPADSGDTLVFGDVQASITPGEVNEDGNRTVQVEITNNSRVTLWVSPDTVKSFAEGRFISDAGTDSGPMLFEVESMETSEGVAEIVYEWFMAIPAGGTGTINMNVSQDIEKICYQPFSQNQSGLTDEETQRIHGCWLLTDDTE